MEIRIKDFFKKSKRITSFVGGYQVPGYVHFTGEEEIRQCKRKSSHQGGQEVSMNVNEKKK